MYSKRQEGMRLRGRLSLFLKQFLRGRGCEGNKDRRLQTQKEASRGFMARHKDYGNLKIRLNIILDHVADRFNISVANIKSSRRHPDIKYARWFVINLACKYTTLSSMALGRALNKDHTTILYACNKLPSHIANDSNLEYLYQSIIQELEEEYGL